jgi:hypothetical protein
MKTRLGTDVGMEAQSLNEVLPEGGIPSTVTLNAL